MQEGRGYVCRSTKGPVGRILGQEPSTVARNFSRLKRDCLDSTTIFSLGKDVLPYHPSKKIVDRVGLIPVIMYRNVQVETARKTSAWYGNAHDAGSAYVGTALGDGMHFTSVSPTTGEWYSQ